MHNTLELFDGLCVVSMMKPGDCIAFTTSNITIPPLSEALFPVASKNRPSSDVIIEGGASNCSSLIVARALLDPAKMCCRVLNPTDRVIKLRARTPVGYLSPVMAVQWQVAIPPPPLTEFPSIPEMRKQLGEKGVNFETTALKGADLDELTRLFYRNIDIMATKLAELPWTDLLYHTIDTGDALPFR